MSMFLYFSQNFFYNKNSQNGNKKNLFESSFSSFFSNPAFKVGLKGFLRVLGCKSENERLFIGLKTETPQNDVVLVAGSPKRRHFGVLIYIFFKTKTPQNDVVLG